MKRRSKFSLTNYKLASMKAGQLVPISLLEVLPGDTLQMSTSALVRVAPLVAPVMHPLHVKIHHWYVPNRLVWEDFESFITGGPDGLDDSVHPTVAVQPAVGDLADYFGIPTNLSAPFSVSALPFRAYNLIFNEWYRWPQLQAELALSLASGADTTTSLALQRADWERDYFTTCTPSPQLGPGVTIPVGVSAASLTFSGTGPVTSNGSAPTFVPPGGSAGALRINVSGDGAQDVGFAGGTGSTSNGPLSWSAPNLTASVTGSATSSAQFGSISINDFREALALQSFEEHRNLYGSRYTEYLRFLGIKASDARLQRPEYLGGGRQTIQFSEVLQTAEGTNPVGTLRGHGIGAVRSNRFRRFIEEHGYVISLMSIIPTSIYSQGIPRTWLRRVKEDYYQKELQGIGEQEVTKAELYAAAADPSALFGYQARYQEYRGKESSVAGEFRDTLDYWHMARVFDNEPALNSDFLECTPTDRIFASGATDQFYVMAYNSVQARRLITARQTPANLR